MLWSLKLVGLPLKQIGLPGNWKWHEGTDYIELKSIILTLSTQYKYSSHKMNPLKEMCQIFVCDRLMLPKIKGNILASSLKISNVVTSTIYKKTKQNWQRQMRWMMKLTEWHVGFWIKSLLTFLAISKRILRHYFKTRHYYLLSDPLNPSSIITPTLHSTPRKDCRRQNILKCLTREHTKSPF